RSFTRFTIRVILPHLGQSVLLVVSMTFLRSPVLAIFAIGFSRSEIVMSAVERAKQREPLLLTAVLLYMNLSVLLAQSKQGQRVYGGHPERSLSACESAVEGSAFTIAGKLQQKNFL